MLEREELSILYDYYAPLLSERQRDCYDLYYNEDLSLSEIAELKNISRQGVWDTIRHAEEKLMEFESKTGLAGKIRELEEKLGNSFIGQSGPEENNGDSYGI